MKKYGLYILYLLLLLSASVLVSCGGESEEEKAKKERGNAIVETGEIVAVNSKAFTLGRYSRRLWEMKIVGLLEHGSIVNAGDSIIQLDPTELNKMILDWETDFEQQQAALEMLLVNQDNARNDLESALKNEEAAFQLKKIELEASRFEAARIRKIKELQFKQSEIKLAKERRKIELNNIIQANDLKIQEIRVGQIENEIKNAYNIIPQLTIRTPIPGVFQIATNWRTKTLLKVGDDVYPGAQMASVPELKWMKIDTQVNETDFLKISLGQKVRVRLDAMPELTFDGEVAYIGKLCKKKDEKSRQKVFDVEVNILKPDERLKPGMTVSCEYLEN